MIATFTKAQKPPCALAQALRRHDTAGSTHAGERGIVRMIRDMPIVPFWTVPSASTLTELLSCVVSELVYH